MCTPKPVLLTTTEVAKILGVGPSSIKRWIDQGHLIATKSPGGHRRIDLRDLTHFAEKTGRKIVYKQSSNLSQQGLFVGLQIALKNGDSGKVSHICQELAMGDKQPAFLIDSFLRPAFAQLRKECPHPSRRCSILHRGIGILSKLELKSSLRRFNQQSPGLRGIFADIGYEVDGLPTFFAEQSAQDLLKTEGNLQLGLGVPIEVILGAITKHKPDFLWISASGPFDKSVKDSSEKIIQFTRGLGTRVILFSENNSKELSQFEMPPAVFIPSNFSGFRSYLLGMTPMQK